MSPAIQVPLLPEQGRTPNPGTHPSISGMVFNVTTTIIGAGIMSIPATLKVLGVIPALILILVVAWLSDISVEFLMRFTVSGESKTYAGVMRECFGKIGSLSVQISVMAATLGCMIIFLIIIGDVLCGNQNKGTVHLGVLQEWFGLEWWNSRAFALFCIVIFILLPLVLFRRVESLKISSAISVLLAVLFVAVSSALAISAILQGKSKNPRLLPEFHNQASFFNLFTAVPVIVTAFTFHFNVHPIGSELTNPFDIIPAVRISLILCAAIYFTIGLFGYLLFGDSIMSDILVNFDRISDSSIGSLLNDLVRLSYALHLVLVFPLLNFSLRANIDELLFPKKPVPAKDNKRFMILTISLLIVSYLAAIAIPDVWYFFQFIGSTAAVSLAFIFPGVIVLRDVRGISTMRDKIIAATMVVLAVVTSIIAISTNIFTLLGIISQEAS